MIDSMIPVTNSTPETKNTPVAPRLSAAGKSWHAGTLTYTLGGLIALSFWLLWGDFAWAMRDRSVPCIIQLLFKRYGASDTLSGALIGSLPAAMAIVITPIIGYKSDRHRGRWGRRIPFLLIPVPVAVVSMVGLAFSPYLGAALHKILGTVSPGIDSSTLVCLTLFWTFFGLASTVANAVFSGLVNDVVPQELMGRFYGMFRALSLVAGILFNYELLGKAESYYAWIFLGTAALYGVGFSLMCLNVKEGKYPPPPEPEIPGERIGPLSSIKKYVTQCFSEPFYLVLFVSMALGCVMTIPISFFGLYYSKSINMNLHAYGQCIAATYLISLLLAYPLGVWADRFHPLRVTLVTIGLFTVICLWGGVYANDTWTFGIALIGNGVLGGAYMTASASLWQRLLPRARFAELQSAGTVISSLTIAICPSALGFFLDCTHHVYRYTFYVSACIGLVALAFTWALYHGFLNRGGPGGYVAPE